MAADSHLSVHAPAQDHAVHAQSATGNPDCAGIDCSKMVDHDGKCASMCQVSISSAVKLEMSSRVAEDYPELLNYTFFAVSLDHPERPPKHSV